MQPAAQLRERLRERAVIGTFLKLPRAEGVEILAGAGYDFVICDLEHAQLDERDARDVLLAGRATGVPVLVRVATADRGLINRLLEAGAAGIQLPRVTTVDDARTLRDLTRYPPEGTRSISQAQPAARFGAEPLLGYLARSNAEVLAVGQFETAGIAAPLDDVVAALDVAFIGTVDLAVDTGNPGDPSAPAVRERIRYVEEASRRTDTPLGVFAGSASAARSSIAAGYRYIVVSTDLSMLRSAAADLLASVTG